MKHVITKEYDIEILGFETLQQQKSGEEGKYKHSKHYHDDSSRYITWEQVCYRLFEDGETYLESCKLSEYKEKFGSDPIIDFQIQEILKNTAFN